MKGEIIDPRKNSLGKVVGYDIQDHNGNFYYAHLGDVRECEQFLYNLRDHKLGKELKNIYADFDKTELKKGQKIEFEKWTGSSGEDNRKEHAYRVKKIP